MCRSLVYVMIAFNLELNKLKKMMRCRAYIYPGIK